MLRPSPGSVAPAAAPVPPAAPSADDVSAMMLGPATEELVPSTTPVLSPLLPISPCHWKPTSAALSPDTSTIMLSM